MHTDLSLRDLVSRTLPPEPWTEGENIPWDDPTFSRRMLREHLSQEHDLASRRLDIIDAHVAWIHEEVLGRTPSRVLDLACGPGLYTHRLAQLGHRCTGVDFSPASIEHARREADPQRSTFVLADLRRAELPNEQDLVLLNYGQLNVFRRADAMSILGRAHDALGSGGQLLLEVQTEAQVRSAEGASPTWHAADGGLFGDGPHVVLHERFWDEQRRTATERWHVIDEAGSVTRFALSTEAYTREELEDALSSLGFGEIEMFDGFGGRAGGPMFGVRCRR